MNSTPFANAFGYRVAALLSCLLLSSCATTVFESAPGARVLGCDSRLVGSWQAWSNDKGAGRTETAFIYVPAGCHPIYLIEDHDDARHVEQGEAHFVYSGQIGYLLLSSQWNGDEEGPTSAQRAGYELLRYQLRRGRLEIFSPDHNKIRQMLLSGELPGNSSQKADPAGADGQEIHTHYPAHNFVTGSPEQIAEILKGDIFEHEPMGTLQRIAKLPDSAVVHRNRALDKPHDKPPH